MSEQVELKSWLFNGNNAEAFMQSEMRKIAELQRPQRTQFVDDRNVHHLTHGSTWVHADMPDDQPTEMQQHSANLTLQNDDISQNNLDAWLQGLNGVVTQFNSSFMEHMLKLLMAGSEKSGNVISASDQGSNAAAFLEMLRTIQFSVDRNGEVQLPQMMIAPSMAQKFYNDLMSQPQAYQDEVAALIKEKSNEALERERERKARFKAVEDE